MATYVSHIAEQIQHNLEFLVAQGAMSREDADIAIARLPSLNSQAAPVRLTPAPPAPRAIPAPPAPQTSGVVRAKATWSYNENGQVSTAYLFQ